MHTDHAIHPRRCFTDVRHLLDFASTTYADRTAFSFRTDPQRADITRISFAQLGRDVRALATELLRLGCQGKHCALIGKTSYEWILTYYATLCIGAVLVPLDHDWSAEELCDTATKANVAFVFADEDVADRAAYIAARVPLDASPIHLSAEEQGNTLAAHLAAGRAAYDADPTLYDGVTIDPLKLALLVFTSGTTGKGKGVMLHQRAILSDMYHAVHYLDYGQCTVGVLPPHHTYGSTVMFLGHVMIGSEVYLSSGLRFITKELAEQRPEHLVLVPLYLETFYRKIIASLKEKGKYRLVMALIRVSNGLRRVGIDLRAKLFGAIHAVFGGRVKTVISGGAPLSREILSFFDSIGICVLNGYGITECAPLISVNRSRHNVLGSVGHPIDGVEVTIDEPNEQGEGEILVKGENVMLGYYGDASATAEAFTGGYFRTGDYGKIDKHGVLYITGRKKNLIILSNGKNVYPEEIENELAATPGLLDIVVYEGHSRRGVLYNTIVAEIYPDRDFFKQQGITDIDAYMKPFVDDFNRRAVPYKKIGLVRIRAEEFPKNTLRKIQRFKIDTTID